MVLPPALLGDPSTLVEGLPPDALDPLAAGPDLPLLPLAPAIDPTLAEPPAPRGRRKLRLRLKPYALPEVERHAKPSVAWILDQKKERVANWQERDARMDRDEELYLMLDALEGKDTGKGGEEVVKRNTAQANIDKLAFMIGRQPMKIKVKPLVQDEAHVDAAQAIEDWLYDVNGQAAERHQTKLQESLGHDEAWYTGARGWLVSRVYWDTDDDNYPACFEVLDPRYCYPRPGKRGAGMLLDMIYAERTDKLTFVSRNPDLANHAALAEKEDGDELDVVWYEDTHYSILLVDDQEVKSAEHNYGFCPWVVTICRGTPARNKRSRGHVGAGAIAPLRHIMAYEQRLLSQIATDIARMGNPATTDYYDSTMGDPPAAMDYAPGARNLRDKAKGQESRIESLGSRPDQVQLMAEVVREDKQRGGFHDVLWGDPAGLQGGFHQAVATNAAEDALFPVSHCIVTHRQWRNRLVLNLVLAAEKNDLLATVADEEADDGLEGTPIKGLLYRAPDREPGALDAVSRYGQRQAWVYCALTPEEIRLNGVDNAVLLRRMTPQDRMQGVQAASMAAQSQIVSRRWSREEWLDVDDPEAMDDEIITEQMTQDPEFMRKVLFPAKLRQRSPELYSQWLLIEQERQAQEQMAPPAGPPGPGGAPLPGQGVPAELLAPPMQAGTGVPGAGDPAAIMAQLAMLANTLPPEGA